MSAESLLKELMERVESADGFDKRSDRMEFNGWYRKWKPLAERQMRDPFRLHNRYPSETQIAPDTGSGEPDSELSSDDSDSGD